jgi:hypothetical protein
MLIKKLVRIVEVEAVPVIIIISMFSAKSVHEMAIKPGT